MKLQEVSDKPHGPRFTRPWIVASEADLPEADSYTAVGPDGTAKLDYIVYETHDGYVKRSSEGKIQVPKKVGKQLLKDPGVVGLKKVNSDT